MQLFGYVLRKPWTKYIDLDIEENVYEEIKTAIAKSITANLVVQALDEDLCDEDCEVLSFLKETAKGN